MWSGTAPGQAVSTVPSAPLAAESPWPLQVHTADSTLTLYQPQIDSWDGNLLTARIAVRADIGKETPTAEYGVLQVAARTVVDKGSRTVRIDEAHVTKADFPAATAEQAIKIAPAPDLYFTLMRTLTADLTRCLSMPV